MTSRKIALSISILSFSALSSVAYAAECKLPQGKVTEWVMPKEFKADPGLQSSNLEFHTYMKPNADCTQFRMYAVMGKDQIEPTAEQCLRASGDVSTGPLMYCTEYQVVAKADADAKFSVEKKNTAVLEEDGSVSLKSYGVMGIASASLKKTEHGVSASWNYDALLANAQHEAIVRMQEQLKRASDSTLLQMNALTLSQLEAEVAAIERTLARQEDKTDLLKLEIAQLKLRRHLRQVARTEKLRDRVSGQLETVRDFRQLLCGDRNDRSENLLSCASASNRLYKDGGVGMGFPPLGGDSGLGGGFGEFGAGNAR